MDKSTEANKEKRKNKLDSLASGSHSFVKIDRITIDLHDTDVMEPPHVHDQFSIRGHVAGWRRVRIKECYPFEMDNLAENKLEESLPKLEVPRYIWWERLLPQASGLEMVVATGGDPNVGPSKNGRRENDGLSQPEDIGNKTDLREFEDVNNHDRGNAIKAQTRGAEAQKETICTKGKKGPGKVCADSSNSKAVESSKNNDNSSVNKGKSRPGNPFLDATNVHPYHSSTRDDKSPESADMSPIAPCPSGRVHDVETENVSSEDERISSKKLRFLNDIIKQERDKNHKKKSASSSRVQTTSTEMERRVSVTQRQIDVPSYSAKGAKHPPTKRKVSHAEDRRHPNIHCPGSSAKRCKGQVQEVEKTWQRVESSNSEQIRDAQAPPNSQRGSKSLLNELEYSRAPDSGKQMNPAEIENGNVTTKERPQVNSNCCADLTKHDASPKTTAKPRSMPSSMGRMPPLFRRSLPGQQMDKVPSVSNSKRPENETIHRPLISPSTSTIGNSNDKGKAPLDLSLSSFPSNGRNSVPSSVRQDRDIPDLNLSIGLNTTAMQGKHLPTLMDTSLPLNKNLETSASGSRAVTGGKEAVSEQQRLSKTDHRAAEEIPMDIVHYLNENQRQRKLENSKGIMHEESTRASNARQTEALPGMASFGLSNRSRIGQSFPISFSHPHKTHFGTNSWGDSQFRIFGPFGQSQQTFNQQRKTPYSASSPVTSGSGPSGISDVLWPPSRPNMPPQYSLPQSHNRSFQVNRSGTSAFSEIPYKGKTVSDIKNPEEKRSVNWPGQMSLGGFKPYPNDTCIPAMQLLSLMNQGIGSSSSVKIGQPKTVPTKTLPPWNNHARVHGNENQNFVNGIYFPQNGPTKDFLGLRYGSPSVSEKNAALFTGQLPPQERSSKGTQLDGPSNSAIRPAGSNLPLGPCTLNRNPADFSIPTASNEYTRTAKDLNSRKKNNMRERPRSLNLAGQKRQRARNAAPTKQ